MFNVKILNQPVVIKTPELMLKLNLPLYELLEWLNLRSTKKDHLVYSEFKNVVLPILKTNNIIRYTNNGHTISKLNWVTKQLIIIKPFSKLEASHSKAKSVHKKIFTGYRQVLNDQDEWVNDYCDDSWGPNDVLLGLDKFKALNDSFKV